MTDDEARQEIIEIERLTNELLKRVAVFMNLDEEDEDRGDVVEVTMYETNVVFRMKSGGELEVDLTA